MENKDIDFLALQETKGNLNSKFRYGKYVFIFSTDVKDWKDKENNKEQLGIGICYKYLYEQCRVSHLQYNARICFLKMRGKGYDIHIISNYSPHNGLHEEIKRQHYKNLEEAFRRMKCTQDPTYILGDFNARFHGKYEAERYTFGPHNFGRGLQYLKTAQKI